MTYSVFCGIIISIYKLKKKSKITSERARKEKHKFYIFVRDFPSCVVRIMTKILEKTIEGKHLIYRGKPLVREGNLYCYGDMEEAHVLFMIVLTNKTIHIGENDVEVPENILIQVLKTDPAIPDHEKIAKQLNGVGLFEAFNAGLVWLDRLNNA